MIPPDKPKTVQQFFEDYELAHPEFRQEWLASAPERGLAEIVITFRSMRGLSQRQLAEKAGMQQPAIARIESAAVNIRWSNVLKIFSALGIGISLAPIEDDLVVVPRKKITELADAAPGPTPDQPITINGF